MSFLYINLIFEEKLCLLCPCIANPVCWACLLLFCLVLSGPLLTSQQAGCTQKLKKLQLFDHLEQGPFFHSQLLTAQKGGKQSFPDDAVPLTTSSLKKKFWEISGNHNWHCYFEGLMAYIITLYFLLSPPVFSKLGWWPCCTVIYWSWIPPKHTFYLQPSAYRQRTLMHIYSQNTTWGWLTFQVSETEILGSRELKLPVCCECILREILFYHTKKKLKT